MKLKSLLAVVALCLSLIVLPAPADAGHGTNPRCGISTYFGTSSWTVARDTGEPYCDVQAGVRRWVNGGYRMYTSGWKLYEASVSSTAGSPVYLIAPNCARYRVRNHHGGVTYTSSWSCKWG